MTDNPKKKFKLFSIEPTIPPNQPDQGNLIPEMEDLPPKSDRHVKLKFDDSPLGVRSDRTRDLLLSIIPENLQLRIKQLAKGNKEVVDLCMKIFVALDDAGLELVTDLDFISDQREPKMLAQDLHLLKEFLVKFENSYRDYQVSPVQLLAKLIKSKPSVSMIELLEIAQAGVAKMLTMAFPARLQTGLAALDWDLADFLLFVQNWEMVNKFQSRREGFQYARAYLESARKTGKFDRESLQ